MSLIAVVLLAFGVCDIVYDSARNRVGARGVAVAAALPGALLAGAVLWLAGAPWPEQGITAAALLLVLLIWSGLTAHNEPRGESRAARVQLIWLAAALVTPLAVSGSFRGVDGDIGTWVGSLPISGLHHAGATRVLLALGGLIFLQNTTNRIVRLVLDSAHAKRLTGESRLRGGRYIGAIERVIVGALVLAGSTEGAGIVIAAKGFIRLPELRAPSVPKQATIDDDVAADEPDAAENESDAAQRESNQTDEVAEYFLIGTLTSIVVAGALAVLIRAAG